MSLYPQSPICLSFTTTGGDDANSWDVFAHTVDEPDHRVTVLQVFMPAGEEIATEVELLLVGCKNAVDDLKPPALAGALLCAMDHLANFRNYEPTEPAEAPTAGNHSIPVALHKLFCDALNALPLFHAEYSVLKSQAMLGGRPATRQYGWILSEENFIYFDGPLPKHIAISGFGYRPVRKIWDESIASADDLEHHQKVLATEMAKKVRRLRCSCCGAETKGRQWFNQDTGYGLCESCIDYVEARATDPLEDTHGMRGVHYALAD